MANVEKNRDELLDHVEKLRADLATLTQTVSKIASDSSAGFQAQIRDAVGKASRNAGEAGQQVYRDASVLGNEAVATTNAAIGQAERQIAKNPLMALFAALGVGFFVGLLSHRR
jgi:ElaB/YqjD/DUF883 family membrane-anchored ribosome-binding protein